MSFALSYLKRLLDRAAVSKEPHQLPDSTRILVEAVKPVKLIPINFLKTIIASSTGVDKYKVPFPFKIHDVTMSFARNQQNLLQVTPRSGESGTTNDAPLATPADSGNAYFVGDDMIKKLRNLAKEHPAHHYITIQYNNTDTASKTLDVLVEVEPLA